MKSRGNILLAWELGDGLGHVGRLLPIADRLAEHGYRPIFAVRDVAGAHQRLGGANYPVVQAPHITSIRSGDSGFFARNFADILGVIGFGDIDRLRVMTRVWRSLVELVDPQFVIGDFAPMLALALADRDIPMLSVGSGFAVPPSQLASFPDINDSGKSIVTEAELLDVANRFLREIGSAPAKTLPALVGGDAQIACTWSALDPYAEHRLEPALGPIGASSQPRPTPPGRSSWFAYIAADSPMARPLIEGLLATKSRGEAYVRKADDSLESRFKAAGHVLHRKVPPLEEMLKHARLILHHGGINTAECALAMGVPQVIVSRHLEQHLTGDSVRRCGAGKIVRGRFEPAALAGLVDRAVDDKGLAQAAIRVAAGIQDRRGCVEQVVQRAMELRSRRRTAA